MMPNVDNDEEPDIPQFTVSATAAMRGNHPQVRNSGNPRSQLPSI